MEVIYHWLSWSPWSRAMSCYMTAITWHPATPNNIRTAGGTGPYLRHGWYTWTCVGVGPQQGPRVRQILHNRPLENTAQDHHTTAEMLLSQLGRKWKLMSRRRAGIVKPGLFNSWFIFHRLLCSLNTWSFLSVFLKQENHRITDWLGLEERFKDHLVHPSCQGQGHLSPDHAAQSPIPSGSEHFQGWCVHNFSGKPAPVPHYPHNKELLPWKRAVRKKSILILSSFCSKPLPCVLALQASVRSLSLSCKPSLHIKRLQ